jgi:hypothetical protein
MKILSAYTTVTSIERLFKGKEQCGKVELVKLYNGVEVVNTKGQVKVGEQVIYIYPGAYISKGSEIHKDVLESRWIKEDRRVRTVKFNIHNGNGKPVVSRGYILKVKQAGVEGSFNPEDIDVYASAIEAFCKVNIFRRVNFEVPHVEDIQESIGFPQVIIGTELIDGYVCEIYKDISSGKIMVKDKFTTFTLEAPAIDTRKTWWRRLTGEYKKSQARLKAELPFEDIRALLEFLAGKAVRELLERDSMYYIRAIISRKDKKPLNGPFDQHCLSKFGHDALLHVISIEYATAFYHDHDDIKAFGFNPVPKLFKRRFCSYSQLKGCIKQMNEKYAGKNLRLKGIVMVDENNKPFCQHVF